MTFEMVLVIGLVVLAIVLFVTEWISVDLVALMMMGALLITGIISPEEGISGFSNVATVTVAAMFILSAGLFKTGSVNFIGTALGTVGKKNTLMALIAMMIGVGTISAFINNTAAVAIFLPIVLGMARDNNLSPSKWLIPLSFASMFGGVCTLIGTSTNILVDSIAERHGQPPFGMFEFTTLGLVMFGAGLVYMVAIGVPLIPERRKPQDLTKNFEMGDYLTEIILLPEGQSAGKMIKDSPLIQDLDIDIINVYRNGNSLQPLSLWTVLQANDVLRVRCDIQKVQKLQEREGILLKSDTKLWDKDLKSEEVTLVEAVIAPNSKLEGKSLIESQFRHDFGATVLAIRHRGEVMHENLEVAPLKAGDVLLLRLKREDLNQLKQDPAFVIVSSPGLPEFRKHKTLPALMIITAVVLTASLNIFPIVVSAILGCILMVLTRCITLEEAYQSIQWQVIFLLAGVLTLGIALEKTEAALFISNAFVSSIGELGPTALVSALFFLTMILTNVMSNNATAALLAPIAIGIAESMSLNPRPFLMAVTFAASLSFMTPVGYQTNTIIYGPGQYKFSDFLRVGTPLNILFWILATILIPKIWPF
ncbi:MAG TPA: SLC13 family permease [Nitrospiria bacterium]|jgi:di/tricarboxylate transporter